MDKVFYTTRTGIKIGSQYTLPLRQLNHDEERVQTALLEQDPQPLNWLNHSLVEVVSRIVFLIAMIVVFFDLFFWRP